MSHTYTQRDAKATTMEVHNRSSLFDTAELANVHNKFDYFDLASPLHEDNFSLTPNLSLVNTTLTPASPRDEFLAKIEQSVLAIIFILTIVGNFLVLMGIYFRKQKMTRMYYFIAHLASNYGKIKPFLSKKLIL